MSFISQLINSTVPSLLFNTEPTSAFTSARIKNIGGESQTFNDPKSRNQLSSEQQQHVMKMLTDGAKKYPSSTKQKIQHASNENQESNTRSKRSVDGGQESQTLTHSKKPIYDDAKKICDQEEKSNPKPHCIKKMLGVYNRGSELDKGKAKSFLKEDLKANIKTVQHEIELWYDAWSDLDKIRDYKKERECPDDEKSEYKDDNGYTQRAMRWVRKKCLHKLVLRSDFVPKGKVVMQGGDYYQAEQNATKSQIPPLSAWEKDDDAPAPKCTSNSYFRCIGDHLDLKEKYMQACQGEWREKNETTFECGVWMEK